jgi:hypothetical protein
LEIFPQLRNVAEGTSKLHGRRLAFHFAGAIRHEVVTVIVEARAIVVVDTCMHATKVFRSQTHTDQNWGKSLSLVAVRKEKPIII